MKYFSAYLLGTVAVSLLITSCDEHKHDWTTYYAAEGIEPSKLGK